MKSYIRTYAISLGILLPMAAHAQETASIDECTADFQRQVRGLTSLLLDPNAEPGLGNEAIITRTSTMSDHDRQSYFSKLSMEITQIIPKEKADVLTSCGMIRDGEFAQSWKIYRTTAIGLGGIPTLREPTHGFDIGRRIIYSNAISKHRHVHKVPFLVSYTKNRLSDESSFSAFGRIAYRVDSGLEGEHSFYTDLAVNTADPVEESIVDIGYETKWRHVSDLRGENPEDPLIDELETTFGVEWNTDRDFKRRAYSASIQLAPSIDGIGAGDYVNRAGGFRYVWQPNLTIAAGNVIDANGHAGFAAMKESGGLLQATPAVSASIRHVRFPNLALGLEYGHTFDLSDGVHKGLFTASASYRLTESVRMTAIYLRGYEPPFFQEVDKVLFGFGITY